MLWKAWKVMILGIYYWIKNVTYYGKHEKLGYWVLSFLN